MAVQPGGPVQGAIDDHCEGDAGLIKTETNQAACGPSTGAAADYDDPRYNSSSYDDDCKYHVSFTVDPVYENQKVTFQVTATKTFDGSPAAGAAMRADVFLDDAHVAPNSGVVTTEIDPGVYTLGPVIFDKPGRWTIRFHFYESCNDTPPDSPHGHAAFYIDVP